MNRLLTTLLIWLLMATLPLHTLAASVSMSCAPVLPQPATASDTAPATASATAHIAHVASGDEHAHHGDHAASVADDAPDDDGPHAKPGTHSSCSACSAFCAGAVAPPSFSLPLPVFDGSDAVVAAPADFVAGFIPDGLQRPPRQ